MLTLQFTVELKPCILKYDTTRHGPSAHEHCSTAGDPAPCHLDRSRGLGLGQGPPVSVGDEARSLA